MIVTKVSFCFTVVLGMVSVLLVLAASAAGAYWLRGDEIAFVSYRAINPDIVLLDVDHDLARPVTHDGSYNVAPAWSPDGHWLAFASDRDGRRSIYVMDAVGGNQRRITEANG